MSEGKVTNINRFRAGVLLAAAAAATVGLAAGKADPEKGKAVFAEQCGVCHNADSDVKKIGPGLKGLFKREKMGNGKKLTETAIRAKIDDGGNGMPAYKETLSDAEKDDVIAYLKTL
jgi:mono/diheme cytochrome c family protein